MKKIKMALSAMLLTVTLASCDVEGMITSALGGISLPVEADSEDSNAVDVNASEVLEKLPEQAEKLEQLASIGFSITMKATTVENGTTNETTFKYGAVGDVKWAMYDGEGIAINKEENLYHVFRYTETEGWRYWISSEVNLGKMIENNLPFLDSITGFDGVKLSTATVAGRKCDVYRASLTEGENTMSYSIYLDSEYGILLKLVETTTGTNESSFSYEVTGLEIGSFTKAPELVNPDPSQVNKIDNL